MSAFDEEVFYDSIYDEMDYKTFVRVISNIPSCVFFKDRDLKYRFVSHRWAQINNSNIIGKTDLEVRIDQENVGQAEESDREILRSKTGCHYFIESNIDGEVSFLELIKEPIIDENGDAIGIVGLINDVTDKTIIRRNLEKVSGELEQKCIELESSNAELKLSLDQIEQFHKAHKLFTTSMNHELRSPLNSISGILQLLMEDSSLNEKQHRQVSAAFQASEFMLDIVNDLLDFARFETREFRINEAAFNLKDMLSGIEYTNCIEAASKNLIFEMHVQEGIADRYFGDEVRIRQIINNFVSNAIKYTAEGKVELSISYIDGNLCIHCSDTGQGIAEESIPSLFDPYTRFNEKKNSSIQGTGLGLSIVKKIIDRMKGEIAVSSEINKGTTFTATIPLAVCSDEALTDTKENQTNSQSESEIDYSRLSALCVDDSKVNADVMVALLNKLGMSAEAVNSGEAAIDKAKYGKYDIIFMDHMMPEMDGIEAMAHIREACEPNATTPVVMLTGNAGDDCEEYYKNIGAAGYLTKPVLMGRIEKTIRALCS